MTRTNKIHKALALVVLLPIPQFGCVLTVTDDIADDDDVLDDEVGDGDGDGDGDGNVETTTNDDGCELPTEAADPQLDVSAIKQFDFSWNAAAGADHYRLVTDNYGSLVENIVGTSVSITVPLHLRHDASYIVRSCNECGCVSDEPVYVTGNLAEGVGYLKAPDTQGFWGPPVLSADGKTLVILAPESFIYVYVQSSDSWSLQSQVQTSGTSLALSGDGNTLAVGDPSENNFAGVVRVFTRTNGIWTQKDTVYPDIGQEGDRFGGNVALSGDGSTLAVGVNGEDSASLGIDGDTLDNSAEGTGAVYVYERSGDDWARQAFMKASLPSGGFGVEVALAGDGNTLAVGAWLEDGGPSLTDSGAVYVFARENGEWLEDTRWDAMEYESTDGKLGAEVALSYDGNTLASGIKHYDQHGAVLIYKRVSVGSWSTYDIVTASNADDYDYFGEKFALSGDGKLLVVGAPREDGAGIGVGADESSNAAENAGAVYVFQREDSGWGLEFSWPQTAYVKAPNTETVDVFGKDVALSSSGGTLVVYASGEDSAATGVGGDQSDNSADSTGAIYFY
jgi:hypothetical protein